MDEILIVDGHSAIFAWSELRELHAHQPLRARKELIAMLTRYQDARERTHVVLVFDGKGKTTGSEGGMDGDILVLYSRSGETADTVIERLVARKGKTMKITVASNDRLELDTVSAFGADCIGLRTLAEMLDETDRSHRREWGY